MTLLIIIAALFALVLINVPIAVAIGTVGVVGVVIFMGVDALVNVPLTLFNGATKFPLIAIPLFILAGALMNTSGISMRLINLVTAMVGFVRGGLAMVNVGVSLFFAEISGSAVADVAATGSVLIPEMKKRKYTPEFSAAITSSSASLAIIIPPSLSMILYGAIADTSIVKLFVAGIIPGLLGGFGLAVLCYRCLSSLLEPVIRRLLIADPVEPAGLPGRGSARLSGAVSSCGWHCSTARDVVVSPRHRWHLALPAPRYPGRHAAHPG